MCTSQTKVFIFVLAFGSRIQPSRSRLEYRTPALKARSHETGVLGRADLGSQCSFFGKGVSRCQTGICLLPFDQLALIVIALATYGILRDRTGCATTVGRKPDFVFLYTM